MAGELRRRPVLRGILEDFRGLATESPRDLWLIYAVKLTESVAYFAVLGVLILYFHDDLRFGDEASGAIFGTWGTLVSLLTFLAGFVADAMGQRRALLIAALTLVVGRALLLASELPALALFGLAVSVWGVASMKPVMTAAIKTHAPAELRSFAYNIFYVVMNLGAFMAGHIVSFLRRSLLGRVIRPGELFGGGAPVATAEARRALVDELLPSFPAPEGAETADWAVRSLGRLATGGRGFEHWTAPDLEAIRAAAEARLAGAEVAAAPFGLSGYELIFLVAALLSVVSLLLLRRLEVEEPAGGEAGLAEGPRGAVGVLKEALAIGRGLFGEKTFWAYLLFIFVLVLVRAIFVHAHSTWPTYMIREYGADVPQAAIWSLNPLMIIFLTPIIGSLTRRFSSWSTIMWGSFVTAASVLPMVVPAALAAVASAALGPVFGDLLDYRLAAPVLFVVIVSVGEALWSPRLYDYVATMAPPGRVASYMGLTQLPLFAAKPVVGLMSGWLLATYCPETGARSAETLWTIVFATTLAGPLIALLFAGWIRAAERARTAAEAAA